ncbi:Gfa-like protein [Roseibacterium elongatum DSM 19469]|uniref:Gfa-like protein n=1 Tax=Roseicyclus elongatus DSM 19469 TaxID=1294273 RepID=W8RQL0_9RHOB|nr:GFA family protein [Roseibacterium elongatum]AHM03419.1 Gfa-like protein [Roseibacterium elongatum DSM 19469]
MTGTTGGCLCAAVRYTLAEAPTTYGACHCGMCRKFSGGVELGIEVPPGGLSFDNDATLETYRSSDWAERGFCRICGSSLFWRLTMPGPMQGLYSLAAGSLDDMSGLTFTTEVYIDAKPDNYAFAGDRARLTEADVMAMVNAGPEDQA